MSATARNSPPARVCAPSLEVAEPVRGNYFVSTYPPFSCWSPTGAEEWRRSLDERRSRKRRTPLGLYVHIPFCADRCHYCYYLSHDDELDQIDRYLVATENLPAEALIVLNKADLINTDNETSINELIKLYEDIGYRVLKTSIKQSGM